MNEPRVLLTVLSVRKSERTGKSYLSGWLGKSRLIGFQGEPDKFGNPTFELYLQAVEERRDERRQLTTVDGVPA